MKKLIFILIVLLTAMAAVCGSTRKSSTKAADLRNCSWPAVQTMKESYHFVDHRNMGAKFQIKGVDGKPLYLLECYINAYDSSLGSRNFDYSGDFECRLTPLYSEDGCKHYRTLLTDNRHAIRDWDSRGLFMTKEMTGNCADYPEYGRVRDFKLRGMDLTLKIKNFQVEQGSKERNAPWYRDRIKELNFEFTVVPDRKATSEVAEPTGYAKPPLADDCRWTWPAVQPIKKNYHFVGNEGAKLQILGTDGTPLYLLECYLNPLDDQAPDFDYSCNFDCRLTSLYSRDNYSTLLTEDKIQTRDWDRARFCIDPDSRDWCPDYPEWGRVRHFKLRGMNITLEVKDFQMDAAGDAVKELDFELTVTQDPTSITEIAEPTKYAYPVRAHPEDPNDHSLNCERVLVQDVDVRK